MTFLRRHGGRLFRQRHGWIRRHFGGALPRTMTKLPARVGESTLT